MLELTDRCRSTRSRRAANDLPLQQISLCDNYSNCLIRLSTCVKFCHALSDYLSAAVNALSLLNGATT